MYYFDANCYLFERKIIIIAFFTISIYLDANCNNAKHNNHLLLHFATLFIKLHFVFLNTTLFKGSYM